MKTTVQTLKETTSGHEIKSGAARRSVEAGGQTVDRVDQVSSVVLLGLAIVGAALAVGLTFLIH